LGKKQAASQRLVVTAGQRRKRNDRMAREKVVAAASMRVHGQRNGCDEERAGFETRLGGKTAYFYGSQNNKPPFGLWRKKRGTKTEAWKPRFSIHRAKGFYDRSSLRALPLKV